MFEAEAVIHDGNGDRRETMYTQLDWQLVDQRKHRLEYYEKLFLEMKRVIDLFPRQPDDHKKVLVGLMGKPNLTPALRIVKGQMKRFGK